MQDKRKVWCRAQEIREELRREWKELKLCVETTSDAKVEDSGLNALIVYLLKRKILE
jgi:hypothetical protein